MKLDGLEIGAYALLLGIQFSRLHALMPYVLCQVYTPMNL